MKFNFKIQQYQTDAVKNTVSVFIGQRYGKRVRFFTYNSSNRQQLDSFSSDAGINVMNSAAAGLLTYWPPIALSS